MAFVKTEIVDKVRAILRDNAEVNALVFGEETSDDIIDLCIDLTVDDFNTTLPVIGTWTAESFPSLYLLVWDPFHDISTVGLHTWLSQGFIYMINAIFFE